MQRPGSRYFRISRGILWLEKGVRTSHWWAQRAALTWTANKVMRTTHQDMVEMPNPGFTSDPGSPARPRIGREGPHLCARMLPPLRHTVCPLSKQALCGGRQKRYPLLMGKERCWAFIISRTFQHFDPSHLLGSHRSWDPVETSAAWTLQFSHFHWQHLKSVSQFFLTLRLSDNSGVLLNPSPEGIYHLFSGWKWAGFFTKLRPESTSLKMGKSREVYIFCEGYLK